MHRTRFALFTLHAFLFAMRLDAQAAVPAGGLVEGVVRSEKGEPLSNALVALRRTPDTIVVVRHTTDSSGAFSFGKVEPGSYLVEVRRLGYKMGTLNSVTVATSGRTDLGVIALRPVASALQRIVVSTTRPAIALLPDRNVYSTSGMTIAAGATATDLLRNIPELEVSAEGTVTTRGAQPRIYINGRRAPMEGEALDRYLQQLPAERIDRVEVIPNPSASYDASGEGGIVNIVLKRSIGAGLGGSIAINGGTQHQRSGSVSLSYQEGPLSLFGTAFGSFSWNRSENSDLRQNLTTQPPTFLQQDARTSNAGRAGNFNLSADLRAGSHGTVWAEAVGNRATSKLAGQAIYTNLDESRIPSTRYRRINRTDVRAPFATASTGYRNAAKDGARTWSLELRRSWNGNRLVSESGRSSMSLDSDDIIEGTDLTSADQNQEETGLSLEASWMRRWKQTAQIETGLRYTTRETRDDYSASGMTSDSTSEGFSAGDFRQRERITAAFVSTTRQLGRLSLQFGLRGEEARSRRALPLTDEAFETSYRALFPSVNASTAIGNGGQVNLSYTRRVDRPWGGILNPAIPSLDPLNRRAGNPYLRPRYTNSFSAAVSRSGRIGFLQFSPYYRRTANSWDQVRLIDTAGISTITWKNVATIATYGASVSGSLSPVGRFGGFMNVSAFREERDATNIATDFSGSSTHFSVMSTASFRAGEALALYGSLTYLPARSLPQGKISPMVFSTFSLRRQLNHGRGALNLSITDPFRLQRFNFTTRDSTHVQISQSTFSARRVSASLSYNFGHGKQRDRPNAQKEEQEAQTPVIR